LCSTCPLHSPCFITVCCLFFSFVGKFGFGCCSLAQVIISVIHYLPCLGSVLLPTHSQSSLHFLCLFTDSLAAKISSLPLPLSPVQFQHATPLLSMFDYTSLFVIQFCWGDQSAQGLCWFVYPGVDRGFPRGLCCSPVCSVT
jgi:hypothetical protein